ncbi:3071_t:CDS:2 [Gigaspora margarita]|uniref:3071_t:CDS:1 n=1 Tax=Gigaspora margarita TaxID=4874 RepID=A0ABN7UE05_GIGMA|nr:3071_t:CDS:2 [Gigaspora margarita]
MDETQQAEEGEGSIPPSTPSTAKAIAQDHNRKMVKIIQKV